MAVFLFFLFLFSPIGVGNRRPNALCFAPSSFPDISQAMLMFILVRTTGPSHMLGDGQGLQRRVFLYRRPWH